MNRIVPFPPYAGLKLHTIPRAERVTPRLVVRQPSALFPVASVGDDGLDSTSGAEPTRPKRDRSPALHDADALTKAPLVSVLHRLAHKTGDFGGNPPRTRTTLLTGLLFLSLAAAGPAAEPPLSAEAGQQTTEWAITYRGQRLMVYSFAPQKFKPYVKALATLDGLNILRDSPFDHLHHHALMYGIRVNGLNFWEETPGCGVQKPVQTLPPQLGVDPAGRPQAVLRQTIHWVAAADAFLPDTAGVALLVEERTLTLTIDEAQKEVALAWKSEFAVGGRTNQVTLSGANYHGLGMRFLQELDPLARHLNAGATPDLAGNKQDVSAHQWGSVSFEQPGRAATLVLYGHPGNARGEATFFTMRTPFAYLSATQGLDREPLVYRRGEKFALNYLLTLYPGLRSPAAINARGQPWETTKP
jgi:hypothetical protein